MPENLTLAESILFSLNISDNDDDELYILNGDTLFSELTTETDVFSIKNEYSNYNWDYIDRENTKALTGFFSFSKKKDFIRALAISEKKFLKSLKIYSKTHSIQYKTLRQWYDLGHLNSYFESRSKITTERAFNAITVSDRILWKTGSPENKIKAESHWYSHIPSLLKIYTPQYIGTKESNGKFWYGIEYLPFIPLNELFVHGNLNKKFWLDKFYLLIDILAKFRENCVKDLDVSSFCQSVYIKKTFSRIEKLRKNEYTNRLYERLQLEQITQECLDEISHQTVIPSILHGDFCFSNILYSGRGNQIKLIDPRGIDEDGNFSITGDQKYDLAKLLHSIIGLYDHIIAGEYTLDRNTINFKIKSEISFFQKEIIEYKYGQLSMRDLIPLVILLFLTMVPLHADRPDRQIAFLLNAKRIYKTYM